MATVDLSGRGHFPNLHTVVSYPGFYTTTVYCRLTTRTFSIIGCCNQVSDLNALTRIADA